MSPNKLFFNVLVRFTITMMMLLSTSFVFSADDEDYAKTINNFKTNPIGKQFFSTAYAYAVFPTIGKGGFGIGGAHGKGRVYRGGVMTGTSSMTSISIGFQAGGQAYSQIIFFQNADAYNDFTSGNFEFGAEASAIAITAGAQASASTTGANSSAGTNSSSTNQGVGRYSKGLATLIVGKGGLMYEAAIAGQKYGFEAVGGK